jgi:RNA polymerase sigma-70 factor (ECF subfamily)
VIDHYRGKSKRFVSIEAAAEDGIEFNEVFEEAIQEKQADISLDRETVEKRLRELKDDYRQVLIYRYVDDLSISEISEITGKSLTGVRVLIHRALKKIKEKMKNV